MKTTPFNEDYLVSKVVEESIWHVVNLILTQLKPTNKLGRDGTRCC